LGRRVSVAACPSPDGSSARASTKGGESEAAGGRRERGGNPAVSGTIIRGTLKTPNSQLVTPISIKLQRPDGCD
jgi:hypothetical protein